MIRILPREHSGEVPVWSSIETWESCAPGNYSKAILAAEEKPIEQIRCPLPITTTQQL